MTLALLAAFALVAGALLSVQTGVNAQLRGAVGHPALAALTSFLVGTVALALYAGSLRLPLPGGSAWGAPWWVWTGGLLGAIYVAGAIVVAPRLGAGLFVGLVVAGQLLAALVLDHFGWLGFPVQSITPWRLAGAVLLIAGAALVGKR
jgi:transporter family-2 protein